MLVESATGEDDSVSHHVQADQVVNAAGPLANEVADVIAEGGSNRLPIQNLFQQKIAFPDHLHAVPRTQPFCIDVDEQHNELDWTDEERLLHSEDTAWMATQSMPGGIHCRPDGGDDGQWIKLAWAYNTTAATSPLPSSASLLDENFPDIVLRGAACLNPALRAFYEKDGRLLPRKSLHHYGEWYTMTEENWPLIGPMHTGGGGVFVNFAHSGFGTMAAGDLWADWMSVERGIQSPESLPSYARSLSLERYQDAALMQSLVQADRGVL